MGSMGIVKGQRVAIITGEGLAPQAILAIEDLISFLQRTLGAVVRWRKNDAPVAAIEEPVLILFGSPAENPSLRRLAADKRIDLGAARLGAEGGIVKALQTDKKTLVLLAGNTQQGACHAAYSFLEQELGVGFFLDGNQVRDLSAANLSAAEREEKPTVPIRGLFHHSVWRHPHLNCWQLWGWDKWKFALDWMRRKRFNTLQVFHDDGGYMWGDIYFRAFPKLPMNDDTLQNFVVDPTWRTEFNKKIFAYARQGGLAMSYNLFYSQVPDFFPKYYPELTYHELGMMNVGIDGTQPQCKELMLNYWGKIIETYGLPDTHVYAVCPYAHETELPRHYEDRNAPTLDAWDVLQKLDPKSKMYCETWCWKYLHEGGPRPKSLLIKNAQNYWKKFDAGLPKEIGVIEWDVVREPHPILQEDFQFFRGRPYIQLTHTVFEGYWPPSTSRNHPGWLVNLYNDAIDNGAEGIMYFHIQAGVYDMSADLAAVIGWVHHPNLREYYRDYARRRFGAAIADTIAESAEMYCDAVDLVQTLTPVCFMGSAEDKLKKCGKEGAELKDWINDELGRIRPKAELFAQALEKARSVAPLIPDDDALAKKYFWELDYVSARFEGIFGLYEAYLLADSDAAAAEAQFQRAINAFMAIKTLFSQRREIRMGELFKMEPDVPFTPAYHENWESRGRYAGGKADDAHVVWERIDKFEAKLRALRPKSLPAKAA